MSAAASPARMRTREGVFERANGGTLLLDEITEMPLDLQSRLLRVLETKRLNRVGGSSDLPVDVRVIASTNRSPAQAFEEGRLREDIYYRLAVVTIELPPLRERGEDILVLADFFLGELNLRNGTRKRLSEELRARFLRHRWPGNVRELRNAVERAYILCDGELALERAGNADAAPTRDRRRRRQRRDPCCPSAPRSTRSSAPSSSRRSSISRATSGARPTCSAAASRLSTTSCTRTSASGMQA